MVAAAVLFYLSTKKPLVAFVARIYNSSNAKIGGYHVYICDVQGEGLTKLTPEPGDYSKVQWAGMNKVAWCKALSGSRGQIFVYDLATRAITQSEIVTKSDWDQRSSLQTPRNLAKFGKFVLPATAANQTPTPFQRFVQRMIDQMEVKQEKDGVKVKWDNRYYLFDLPEFDSIFAPLFVPPIAFALTRHRVSHGWCIYRLDWHSGGSDKIIGPYQFIDFQPRERYWAAIKARPDRQLGDIIIGDTYNGKQWRLINKLMDAVSVRIQPSEHR